MNTERTMNKLNPSIGPTKWRRGVEARFQFNAQRCRKIAQRLTDPEEKAYTLNLAELWGQLAEAARFRHEFMRGPVAARRR
jgi:hypothetical protein